jgi:hypothetical protein
MTRRVESSAAKQNILIWQYICIHGKVASNYQQNTKLLRVETIKCMPHVNVSMLNGERRKANFENGLNRRFVRE